MGTQQRSSPHTIEVVEKVQNGVIGRAYFAKAWYSNTRKSMLSWKDRREQEGTQIVLLERFTSPPSAMSLDMPELTF